MGLFRHRLASAGALVAVAFAPLGADAVPRLGRAAPSTTLEDADGRATELRPPLGKPLIVVYEDRDSATQNEVLKQELGKFARTDEYTSRVVVVAVADVSAWDFPPAKHFVRDAIRELSRKTGTTIYCDWTGAFRSAYELRKGVSNVLLVGGDGRVLFASEGPLDAEQRTKLFSLVRADLH